MRLALITLLVIAITSLSACGQVGPLYLPEDQDDETAATEPVTPGGATAEEFSEEAEDDEEQDDAPEP